MKITVEQTFSAGTTAEIEFPHAWTDVEEWWIKWDVLYYRLKGRTEVDEVSLNSPIDDCVDMKRPCYVRITNEEGDELDEE